MYQNIFYNARENEIHLWDDKKGYMVLPYEKYAYKKKAGGQYKSIFGDELEKVTDFNPHYHGGGMFESDVAPDVRTLIDLYGDDDNQSTGHVIFNYDIEVDSEGGFATTEDADKEITSIAFKDSVSQIRHVYILDKEDQVQDKEFKDKIGNVVIRSFDNEKNLLLSFLDKYEEIAPTIITGWNIDYFDNVYLFNRLRRVLKKEANRLSPIGICRINPRSGTLTIAGVSSLDYFPLYKVFTYTELPNYRLDTVGLKEVKMGKIEYDGNLNDLFKTDINKFVEYNLTDIDIVDAIDNKMKLIDLVQSVCHTCHAPYESYQFSSRYLEGALLTYLRKSNLVAPNKPKGGKEKLEELKAEGVGFSGAYVKAPIPGLYKWLFDLDLTSLYPSIIMSVNISPETLIGKVYSYNSGLRPHPTKKKEKLPSIPLFSSDDFVGGKIDKVYFSAEACEGEAEIGDQDVMAFDDFKQKLLDQNISIASNGAMYRNDKVGLLGSILDTWFNLRVEFRALEKDYGLMATDDLRQGEEYYIEKYSYEKGNVKQKKEFSDLHKFYKKRQHVQKILLNSLYGVLGLPVFRFYNIDNAEAVTSTGQTVIKTSSKIANQYYKKITGEDKDYTIYIDTDSLFLSAVPIVEATRPEVDLDNDDEMTEAILEIASDVQSHINGVYDVMSKKMFNIDPEKHRFEIKQEVISKRGLWLAKKRYAQWQINENGVKVDEGDELDVKGLDIVRSSFPKKFQSVLKEIVIDTLTDEKKSVMDTKILDFKNNITNLSVEDIAKNTSIKNFDKYEDPCIKEGCVLGQFPKVYDENGRTMSYTAHAKATLNHNNLLKHFGIARKHEPIRSGDKIKYVYLKKNELGIEELAFKGYDDAPEIMDFIIKYSDGHLLFDKELKNKLDVIYDALHWDYPSEADKFFEF